MKHIIIAFSLVITCLSFGQDKIELPELNTGNKVYTLKFTPDAQDKAVISAYMKGTIQNDSLRFWAEGTILIQNVMVTVLSPDKKAKVKVDIVKDHWEDSKRNGYLKDGVFQDSFNTSNKFGIVITSDTPNVPYYLAVWTSGEIIPKMGNLYINPSNEGIVKTQNSNLEPDSAVSKTSENTNSNTDTNFYMPILIGVLVVIALLLIIMVYKQKKGATLFILICLFSNQDLLYAQSQSLGSILFRDISRDYSVARNLAQYARDLREAGYGNRPPLNPYEDADAEADVNPAGGPRLPSSCIPPRYGNNSGGSTSPSNTEGNSTEEETSNNDTEESDDETEPTLSEEDAQEYAAEKNLLRQARNELNQKARELLNENINNSQTIYNELLATAQSTYNAQIAAAADDPELQVTLTTAFNTQIATLTTANTNRIQQYQTQYQQQVRLNDADYERRLKQLKERYGDSENDDAENQDENDDAETSESEDEQPSENDSDSESDTDDYESSDANENEANNEGCQCLDRAYIELDKRRLNLERLRIIYAHSMKKIRAGIAFGDNVSGVHGVSGLAWQSQKMIILKESIPTLDKAYDDKYAEMIEALEENLLEIDRCEKLLGYENWYSHAGFIYYQFMADKYKRN